MKRIRAALALSALCAATAPAAPVQAEGYAIDRFEPAPAGDRLFGVQSPATQGDLDLHVMLLTDYAHNPFVLTHNRGVADVGSVVEHQLFMRLDASLALWKRLTVGVDVPLALVQDGSTSSFQGRGLLGARDPAFGDLRIHLRGSMWELDDAFAVGAGGYLWMPTGASDNWVSDNTVRGAIEILLGGVAHPVYWGLSMGPHLRDSKELIAVPLGSTLTWGAGAGVLLGEDDEVQLGPELKASITLEDVTRRNTDIHLLLGAKYRFLDDWQLGAAAGPGLAEGIGTADFRGVLSFAYSPDIRAPKPPSDGDGDAIADEIDACPEVAGVGSPEPALHGCPPPAAPPDGDGDGVPDSVDACPDEVGMPSDAPALDGCPADADGDGTPDIRDACPGVSTPPELSDPARPGCPLADTDGDGIADAEDACPEAAGAASDTPDANGCPGDSDGDSIRDDLDACPDLSGKDDPDPEKRGCPTAVRLQGDEIVILQQVQFATGTARIEVASSTLLDEVAQVLKEHPEILSLQVQGHTDDQGPARVNQRLSQQRAEAVMKALTERGIVAARLSAKGYGPDQPIADNGSEEGRAENRRVQLEITKREGE